MIYVRNHTRPITFSSGRYADHIGAPEPGSLFSAPLAPTTTPRIATRRLLPSALRAPYRIIGRDARTPPACRSIPSRRKANMMRAVGIMVHGGPEVLEVVDLPEVHPGSGQVRIRVYAAAVNPTDIGARDGSRADQQKADPPPYVLGMDAAGIVDEVGGDVSTDVKVGDAVMAMVVPKGSHGAYREQIVLNARAVVRAPKGTTHIQACTLPMNGLTARQSLDLLGLSPGQVIAVTGAAGAYRRYVLRL